MTEPQTNLLTPLKDLLKNFNAIDLASAVGGLQLLPENANRALRLEIMSQVAASLPQCDTQPKIRAKDLKSILNSYPLADSPIQLAEDPCDNAFTEAFSFHGGSYIVFPGIVENSTFILKHLIEALLRTKDPIDDDWFLHEIISLVASILTISNEVARRIGLSRGVEPGSARDSLITVPKSSRLEELKKAVTFTEQEIIDLLYSKGGYPATLDRIVLEQGTATYDDFTLLQGDLYTKPIVRHKDIYVVAIPSMLLVAARHAIINLAIERNLLDNVIEKYADQVWLSVVDYFRNLGNMRIDLPLPQVSDIPFYRDGLFRLDTDKVLYAGLVMDPLTNFDSATPFGHWAPTDLETALSARWEKIDSILVNSFGS